jgi:hypothetical protein
MTVMGEEAATIYRNQGELRSQLAQAAGVAPSQVLFYNQTANVDARTGVTAVSVRLLQGWWWGTLVHTTCMVLCCLG